MDNIKYAAFVYLHENSNFVDSVHGNDATYVAKEYLKSIKNLKKWRSGLPCLSIRQGLEFQSVLQFLLVKQSKSVGKFILFVFVDSRAKILCVFSFVVFQMQNCMHLRIANGK